MLGGEIIFTTVRSKVQKIRKGAALPTTRGSGVNEEIVDWRGSRQLTRLQEQTFPGKRKPREPRKMQQKDRLRGKGQQQAQSASEAFADMTDWSNLRNGDKAKGDTNLNKRQPHAAHRQKNRSAAGCGIFGK